MHSGYDVPVNAELPTQETNTTLAGMLKAGLRAAWAELDARQPSETAYAFGLYTDSDLLSFSAIAMTEEALSETVERYAGRHEVKDLRWAMGDSPYIDRLGREPMSAASTWAMDHLTEDLHFSDAAHAQRLEAIADAIRALDAEGRFGTPQARARLIVSVFGSDESPKRMIEVARMMNPTAAVAWLIETLDLPGPRGVAYRVGARRYSVDDVCAGGGRILVAGRPSMLFERDADGAYQQRRRWRGPEAKACALAPDGATAYLAQDDGIVQLSLADPKAAPQRILATGSSPVMLALSPCGRFIAAEIFEGDLVVLDTSGQVRFRRKRDYVTFGSKRLAWHPDGARLAITDGARVRLLDAATGAELWSAPTDVQSHAVTIDPTGRWLAFAQGVWIGADPSPLGVGLFDLEAPDAPPALSVELGESEASELAFSPSGELLAVACRSLVRIFGLDAVERVLPRRSDHEDFAGIAWLSEAQLAAVGRDVDEGPALVVFSANAES